jgi:hypothetical protein
VSRATCLLVALTLAGCSGELLGPEADSSGNDAGSGNDSAGSNGNNAGDGSVGPGGAGNGNPQGGNGGVGQGSGGAPIGNSQGFVASESVARRLSRAELNNTLRDLLADDTAPASQFLPEDQFSPYDNDYTLQLASAALIDSLEGMAEGVAAQVLASPTARAAIVPCTPSSAGDTACFRQVTENLLTRAFRRPVTTEEVDRYLPLLEFATEDNPAVDNDFYTAVGLLIRSLLQDPEFLYRIEIGTPTEQAGLSALGEYEIASRLSYFLTGSMPDDALFADADAGRLTDAASRRQVAARVLDTAQARAQVRRFHTMWLGYRAIPQSAELVAAFNRETSTLIDRVVFDEPQDYMNLFTFGETYADTALAEHYGLPAPPGGEGWVAYGNSGRAGILSHGSVLSTFGKFSDTSPTQRGIFVRTRLMCDTVKAPPPNVNSDQPPANMDAACKIDRYEQHRTSSSCGACHQMLDSIGFGLENYNLAGQWRDADDGKPECTIAGVGEVKPYGTFRGPAELAELLIANGEIDDCVVKQLLSFAVGRPLLPEENEPSAAFLQTFRADQHSLKDLLLTYVADPAFAKRLEPVAEP